VFLGFSIYSGRNCGNIRKGTRSVSSLINGIHLFYEVHDEEEFEETKGR
jgi:hypothetical protein